MQLRYAKPLPIGLLVVGSLLLLLALATGEVAGMVTGPLLMLVGGLQLRNPTAVIKEGELRRMNPLGMTLKRYPVASPADLRVEGKKVIHSATGKTAATLGFGIDAADAAAWRDWIGNGAQQ